MGQIDPISSLGPYFKELSMPCRVLHVILEKDTAGGRGQCIHVGKVARMSFFLFSPWDPISSIQISSNTSTAQCL